MPRTHISILSINADKRSGQVISSPEKKDSCWRHSGSVERSHFHSPIKTPMPATKDTAGCRRCANMATNFPAEFIGLRCIVFPFFYSLSHTRAHTGHSDWSCRVVSEFLFLWQKLFGNVGREREGEREKAERPSVACLSGSAKKICFSECRRSKATEMLPGGLRPVLQPHLPHNEPIV